MFTEILHFHTWHTFAAFIILIFNENFIQSTGETTGLVALDVVVLAGTSCTRILLPVISILEVEQKTNKKALKSITLTKL